MLQASFAKIEKTDFEGWAKLLICRKVPADYQDFVKPEVVHHGADILKRGDAFEVRVRERGEILVTPFPD